MLLNLQYLCNSDQIQGYRQNLYEKLLIIYILTEQ